MTPPRGGGCDGGAKTGEGWGHLVGGDGGCWAADAWPAGQLGGTHCTGGCAYLSSWAEPDFHDCGSLVAYSGG